MNAPARIHAKVHGFRTSFPDGARRLAGGWDEIAYGGTTEYVRADLVALAVGSAPIDGPDDQKVEGAARRYHELNGDGDAWEAQPSDYRRNVRRTVRNVIAALLIGAKQ